MPFNDLREFIDKLEKEGEVQRIEEEVDWDGEAGAMLRRSNELNLPAPFFQKIKGYPKGYTIIGGTLANFRRISLAMDLDTETSRRELQEEYLRRKRKPIKPILVNSGPCKENIFVGDKVDLFKLPVPLIHNNDGGRYIGTWHLTISKDPDSDWVNWGMYRHMVHDKNTIALGADPITHVGTMYSKSYEPNNIPMPIAIAIGVEPISTFCSGTNLPYGVSEADIAGGIRGEPIELVKCETVDLSVPATSEIVIEGEVRPYERKDEGPFGEFTGFMCRGHLNRPVIHVTAVTHRNNPILAISNEGMPIGDSHAISSISRAAEVLDILRGRGIPVTGVNIPPETSYVMAIIGVKTTFANMASEVAMSTWASRGGRSLTYVIIVDDDVDPFNIWQVLHAMVLKCNPERGIVKLHPSTQIGYYPSSNKHERKYRVGSKVYFDCTWPFDWDESDVPFTASFEKIYDPEVKKKALEKWRKYGY